MITRMKQSWPAKSTAQLARWAYGWLTPPLLRRRTFAGAIGASLVATLYWGLIASDRYVSEAHIIIQHTDLAGAQNMDFGSLIGAFNGSSRADQLFLRDHLLSVDMLKKLDTQLGLRAHYSDPRRDLLSRMWFEDAPMERFYLHYLSRISVELDDYSGVLVLKAQGYDPKTAHGITALLVGEGERFRMACRNSLHGNR
jgi:capsular polysaccharide transport system permease protein